MPHASSRPARGVAAGSSDGTVSAAGEPTAREDEDRSAVAAAGVVALQAVGLVAAGVWLMIRALGHDARHRGSTEVLGAMSVLAGVGVLYLARAVLRRNGRVRSILLVLEIICLPIAVTTWQGGRWYVGLPLALSAVLALVLAGLAGLLAPSDDHDLEDDA